MMGEGGTCSLPDSPKTKSDSTPSPQSSPNQKLQHELPTKPLSIQEENKKKGFFPISWRVIGGGVMIGREEQARVVKG